MDQHLQHNSKEMDSETGAILGIQRRLSKARHARSVESPSIPSRPSDRF